MLFGASQALLLDPARIAAEGADSISANPPNENSKDIAHLLARTPAVRAACDLDLLMFLHRHPRALLTSEQLAAFVGYDIKQLARSLDAFIDAGLLERTQNPMHAARMYILVLDGPQGEGLTALLQLASTWQGRQSILSALGPHRRLPSQSVQGKRLLKIA